MEEQRPYNRPDDRVWPVQKRGLGPSELQAYTELAARVTPDASAAIQALMDEVARLTDKCRRLQLAGGIRAALRRARLLRRQHLLTIRYQGQLIEVLRSQLDGAGVAADARVQALETSRSVYSDLFRQAVEDLEGVMRDLDHTESLLARSLVPGARFEIAWLDAGPPGARGRLVEVAHYPDGHNLLTAQRDRVPTGPGPDALPMEANHG